MDDPTCKWTDPRTGHVCGMYADIHVEPANGTAERPGRSATFDVLCPEHRADYERRHGAQAV